MILKGGNLKRYVALRDSLDGVASWREIAKKCSSDAEVFAPAPPQTIQHTEQAIGTAFPADLRALYAETNGVRMSYGASAVMSVEDLVRENLAMRNREQFGELYMPFDNLVLIGQAGNGDLWAYGVLMNNSVSTLNMYGWDHETDARPWVASNLRDLLMRIGLRLLTDACNA